MTGLRVAVLAAVAGAAGGCFDVSSNHSTPVLIDDFDSGDALPRDRHFDQWRCGETNTNTPKSSTCDYDAATYLSPPYSIYLKDTVVETSDQKNAGAQLYTQAVVPEDFSDMSQVVFSSKFDPGSPAIPPAAKLYVELYCSGGNVVIEYPVPNWQSSDWQMFAIPLSQFEFRYGRIPGGTTACLESVDSIHFSVNAGLPNGETGIFGLHLDEVYFR